MHRIETMGSNELIFSNRISKINRIIQYQYEREFQSNNYQIGLFKNIMNFVLHQNKTPYILLPKNYQIDGPFLIRRNIPIEKLQINRKSEWSQKQQIKFVAFFYKYGQIFSQIDKLSQWEMFKSLARFLKGKNFRQSRSHYIKVCKKYGSIVNFINHLEETYQNFETHLNCYKQDLENFQLFPQNSNNSISMHSEQKLYLAGETITKDKYPEQQNEQQHRECFPSNTFFLSSKVSILQKFYPNLGEGNKQNMGEKQLCQNMFVFWPILNKRTIST